MKNLSQLAQKAVEDYIEKGVVINPPRGISKVFLKKRAGVFVTIKKDNNLRGCIGTYLPTKENIAQEVISNAIAAALKDYRFKAIKKEELKFLSYSVSILGEVERVEGLSDLDPKQFGIIVKSGIKIGLLLPDLPGLERVEDQIIVASQKAGIDLNKEKIKIYRFKVEKNGNI